MFWGTFRAKWTWRRQRELPKSKMDGSLTPKDLVDEHRSCGRAKRPRSDEMKPLDSRVPSDMVLDMSSISDSISDIVSDMGLHRDFLVHLRSYPNLYELFLLIFNSLSFVDYK